jgi:hypothetical protein
MWVVVMNVLNVSVLEGALCISSVVALPCIESSAFALPREHQRLEDY